MEENEGTPAIAPMGLDSHVGSIRAAYPIKDVLCFVHGSTGCSIYPRYMFGWHDNSNIRLITTGIEMRHVIFGGESVLEEGLLKAIEVFQPRLVVLQNTCIPALTGDDSEGIARKVMAQTGVRIISTSNPNYRGTQLDGYQNVVSNYIKELMQKPGRIYKNKVNLIGMMPGEYNWINNLNELIRIINALGLTINCILVGDETTVQEVIDAPQAEASIVIYPEVGISAAKLMQERFGTPYIFTDYPPVGIKSTREWILKIAEVFGVTTQAEEFMDKEMKALGSALNKLEQGQWFNLQFLFGKTYAIESAPFQIPAMVKFLWEDLSMIPTTITFQEYEAHSLCQLENFLNANDLSPEIQSPGDHFAFQKAIKQHHTYPYGDPWIVFGSSLDAQQLALTGEQLPVVRFSFPVFDQSIITDRPFVGFRGVVTLTEQIHNTFLEKLCYTRYAVGNIPDPYEVAQNVDKSLFVE